jgi:hypothetical protein
MLRKIKVSNLSVIFDNFFGDNLLNYNVKN